MVAYTVIMSNYDVLRPVRSPSICLTDGQVEPSKGWEVRRVERVCQDVRRASRYPKIMAHAYFPEVEYTVYMDGNIELLCSPEEVVKTYLQKHDMALFPHPQRRCVYAEARKCIRLKKVRPSVAEKQMAYYRKQGLPPGFGLTACWVIIRRNTAEVRRFSEEWWQQYLRFSCRDQLSFDYVRWRLGMKYDEIPGNLFKDSNRCFLKGKHRVGKSRRKK